MKEKQNKMEKFFKIFSRFSKFCYPRNFMSVKDKNVLVWPKHDSFKLNLRNTACNTASNKKNNKL